MPRPQNSKKVESLSDKLGKVPFISSFAGEKKRRNLYHFRDNTSGDEVDAIIEFKDGEYAAFEIKLSDGSVQDAIDSLSKFYQNVEKSRYICAYSSATLKRSCGIRRPGYLSYR